MRDYTRAVYLKLCKDLIACEFKRTLKENIARRGTPDFRRYEKLVEETPEGWWSQQLPGVSIY